MPLADNSWQHDPSGNPISIPPEKRGYQKLACDSKPHSEKRGGLNGSMQHLLKIFLYASRRLNSLTGTNSNKTKALFRF